MLALLRPTDSIPVARKVLETRFSRRRQWSTVLVLDSAESGSWRQGEAMPVTDGRRCLWGNGQHAALGRSSHSRGWEDERTFDDPSVKT